MKMALGSQFWEKWIGERELLKEGDAGVGDSEERMILGSVGGGRRGEGAPSGGRFRQRGGVR